MLQQVGAPDEVYLNPTNLFVAKFVGSPVMNVNDARIEGNSVMLNDASQGFHFPDETLAGTRGTQGNLTLGVRPEAVLLSHDQADGFVEGVTTNIEPLGSHDIVDECSWAARCCARAPKAALSRAKARRPLSGLIRARRISSTRPQG